MYKHHCVRDPRRPGRVGEAAIETPLLHLRGDAMPTLTYAVLNASAARLEGIHAKEEQADTDAVDARTLAAMGQTLDLPRSRPPSQWQTVLRELHTARQALAKDRTAAQNRQKQARVPLLKRQCVSRLRHIERQLEALEAEMLKHVKSDSAQARALEILKSIPGIGAVTAVAVLAEVPEIGSLDPKGAAGLAPITRQSGTWQGRSFVQGGRRRVRQALYMPAVSAISCNPDLARKYRQLCAAGKPSKVAITAVMRKLLLLANALIAKDRTWAAVVPTHP